MATRTRSLAPSTRPPRASVAAPAVMAFPVVLRKSRRSIVIGFALALNQDRKPHSITAGSEAPLHCTKSGISANKLSHDRMGHFNGGIHVLHSSFCNESRCFGRCMQCDSSTRVVCPEFELKR